MYYEAHQGFCKNVELNSKRREQHGQTDGTQAVLGAQKGNEKTESKQERHHYVKKNDVFGLGIVIILDGECLTDKEQDKKCCL